MFPMRETPTFPTRKPPTQILVPVALESPRKSTKKATPSFADDHEVQPSLPCTKTKLGFPALSEVDYMDPMPDPGVKVLQHFRQEPSCYLNLVHLTSVRTDDKATDPVHRSTGMDATQTEVSVPEKKGTWVHDIPIANAMVKILPDIWVLGLFGEIIKAICLVHKNPNWIPATQSVLKINPDGNTRPDITFAVSLATILRYLSKTPDKNTIVLALFQLTRAITPLRSPFFRTPDALNLIHDLSSTIECIISRNDNGILLLTTSQKITSKIKSNLIKWHHYWFHMKSKNSSGTSKTETMTKDSPRDCYECIRFIYQDWLSVCDDMSKGELKSGSELTLSGL